MASDVATRAIHRYPASSKHDPQWSSPSSKSKQNENRGDPMTSGNRECLQKVISDLEKEAIQRQKRADQSRSVQMSTDLVDFFGSMVIFPALRKTYTGPLKFFDWHNELRHIIGLSYIEHLTRHRKNQIKELMLCMEKIAHEKGISSAHWCSLIFLNVTREPSRESFQKSNFSPKQLLDLKQLAEKSLEKRLSDTVNVLVHAVEKNIYY